ncbi:MAG: head-tail adaptor protein [Oscillospiraceae bacterium]|nr:head-tail adaptor protein [Oscillospiraceae bacterium]
MNPFEGTVLQNFVEEIVLYDETTVSDGLGGFTTEWVEGAEISVAIIQPHDAKAAIANAIVGQQSITILTSTSIELKRDKYFRRASNGKTYKIDHDNTERLAPDDSDLQWRTTTAAEVALPKSV